MTRRQYVRQLLDLGHRHGEIPVYASPEWEALDPTDPRRFASVVRAAEAWRLDGEPDAVRQRLRDDDLLARARIRLVSYDLSELPWQRIREIDTARRDAGDPRYRKVAV